MTKEELAAINAVIYEKEHDLIANAIGERQFYDQITPDKNEGNALVLEYIYGVVDATTYIQRAVKLTCESFIPAKRKTGGKEC